MRYSVSPLITSVHPPPISEVKTWAAARPDGTLPLIDLCQAVPDYAPPPALNDYLKKLLDDPLTSKYSPDEGLIDVREAICSWYRHLYAARMSPDQICLTIGASQAFWLAIVTLCAAGDEVVVQTPYYFDHPMALALLGIKGVYAPFSEENGGIPSASVLEPLITPRTRALLVVTPNNPTGAITPPAAIDELYGLARRHRIALILDETYNCFIPGGSRPHDLFIRPDWDGHLIHLASFGKTLALTGYRAGMLAASAPFIEQALKAQDTMAVCQPRITQHAVRFGLDNLGDWIAEKREVMARRHDLFREEFLRPGNCFDLSVSGAFFAWVRHPWEDLTGRQAARRLVDEAGILCLPGEVFGPGLERYLRLAFGNISHDDIPGAVERFRTVAV